MRYSQDVTAKEALLECVQQLSEEQAEGWLGSMRDSPPPIPWRLRPLPPPWREMLEMSPEEQGEVLARWPPETDMEEFLLWEQGTLSDWPEDEDE